MRIKFVPCLLLLFVWIVPARANEMYTYVGNPFGLCAGSYASFGRGCNANYSVSGSFTTTHDSAHRANLDDYTLLPGDIASFSFTNNVNLTITQDNLFPPKIQIDTDAFGHIVGREGWLVYLSSPSGNIVTSSVLNEDGHGGGSAQDWSSPADLNAAYGQSGFGDAGRWSDEPAPEPTPEPGTFVLFGVGLCVLLLVKRGKQAAKRAWA